MQGLIFWNETNRNDKVEMTEKLIFSNEYFLTALTTSYSTTSNLPPICNLKQYYEVKILISLKPKYLCRWECINLWKSEEAKHLQESAEFCKNL